ncbi:MAG TPA: N-acetylmuramoyl-L-alanine amidase [Hyphomicrobiaceae bacterium]
MLAATMAALIGLNLVGAACVLAQAGRATGWTIEVNSEGPAGRPAVTRAHLTANDKLTRLELELTREVAISVSTMTEPDRVIVDLPEVDFRIASTVGQNGKGLIKAFRYGLFGPRQSRVVIDTDGPVHVRKARVETSGQTARLVIELAREAIRPAPDTPAVDAAPVLRPSKFEEPPPAVTLRKGKPVVVVDAGHGGVDPGAIGPDGLPEKDIVLSVARRLRNLLVRSGRYTVVMTRNRDMYISLEQRVRTSRRHGADLFISIHADSVAEESLAPHVRGGSIYTLSDRASNEEARRLADKENAADLLAGLESTADQEEDEVRDILIDLLRRETENFSADFSNLLTGELRKHIVLARDPQRSAAFQVLKQAETPSVLVELGYVSNPEDRKLLTSPAWQDKVAGAMLAAIDSFFARRAMGMVHAP